jgi:hypothetical protein
MRAAVEGPTHVVLKMLGLILIRDCAPRMEPGEGHHRKYRPDLVSEDGTVWVECGKISMKKLADLASDRHILSLLVMRNGAGSAQRYRGEFLQKAPVHAEKVLFYGWDAPAVAGLVDRLRRSTRIEVLSDERTAERVTLGLRLNGEAVTGAAQLYSAA